MKPALSQLSQWQIRCTWHSDQQKSAGVLYTDNAELPFILQHQPQRLQAHAVILSCLGKDCRALTGQRTVERAPSLRLSAQGYLKEHLRAFTPTAAGLAEC